MLVICLFIALLLPLSVLAQFDLNFDHEIDEPIFNSNPILNDLLRETELEISLFDKRDDSALLAQAAGTAVSGTSQPLPSSSAGSGSSQAQLNEFTPISNEIKQSETQFYSFGVNTSSGIGEYYEFLIFLTGNICLQPSVLPNNASLTVYYSFNSTMFQNMEIAEMVHFENGYFQALTDVPINLNAVNSDSILYIAVRAPENTNQSVTWSYEIGVSQNDLVFQWDDRAWASVVDTDENSALIVTGNLTSRDSLIGSNLTLVNATQVSKYELFIYLYDYKDYFNQLNSSWCAIRNGPSLFPGKLFESLFTNRSGFLQQQFYVDSLNSSTTYIAYLVSDFGGSNFGGAVYQPFEFTTLSDDACELIYNLNFCDKVAYSVPGGAEDLTKEQLGALYDNQAASFYTNFSKALQQIACDTSEDAIFSPVVGCQDCAKAYKDWLCAVTIPRCLTNNGTGYMSRPVNNSRNDFINNEIQPASHYYEILPCIDVCNSVARTCPQQFGFLCPTTNSSIELLYFWDLGEDYITCNYVGTQLTTSWGNKLRANAFWILVVVFAHML